MQLISEIPKQDRINIPGYDGKVREDTDLQPGQGHYTPAAGHLASHVTSLGFRSLKSKVETIPISIHLPARVSMRFKSDADCIQILALPHSTKSLTVLLI